MADLLKRRSGWMRAMRLAMASCLPYRFSFAGTERGSCNHAHRQTAAARGGVHDAKQKPVVRADRS